MPEKGNPNLLKAVIKHFLLTYVFETDVELRQLLQWMKAMQDGIYDIKAVFPFNSRL